jgi:hypothetical protein
MCSEFKNCTGFIANSNIFSICKGLIGVSWLLLESVQDCIIIDIGCVRLADINNDFWYRLVTTDKKTSFFVSFKWY